MILIDTTGVAEETMMNARFYKEEIQISNPSTFPRPGTTLNKIITDPDYRQAFRLRIKQGNRWIVPLYKLGILPLFGFSEQVMLLITRGRKSQKRRYTPIGFFRIDNTLYLLTGWGKKADWYKNICVHPGEVFIQIGLHKQRVIPEFIEDPDEIQEIIKHLICQDPQKAQAFIGWDPAQDDLATADFSFLVENVLAVRFYF